MKKILIILLVFLDIAIARASEDKPIQLFHFEDSSCGAWVKSASSPTTRNIYEFWFRGFVSGYNFGSDKYQIINGMPHDETLALYIDKYCRENPLNPFTAAALKLVDDLKAKK